MHLRVLINPAAGASDDPARTLLLETTQDLLAAHAQIARDALDVQVSLSAEHLGDLATELIGEAVRRGSSTDALKDPVVLVVCGGDGSVHEVINAVLRPIADMPNFHIPPVRLVIVPAGTANALYASLFAEGPRYSDPSVTDPALEKQLQSVLSLTKGSAVPGTNLRPLSVSRTQIHSTDGELWHDLFSFVVTSTSFHASLLDTAEELRKDVPTLSRFTQAARANINKVYNATARLLPSSSGPVRRYDPTTDAFVDVPPEGVGPDTAPPTVSGSPTASATADTTLTTAQTQSPPEPGTVELVGPFSYFLSTLNVDRLEPTFRVAPLQRSHPPAPGETDVIIMRPWRNPVHGAARYNSAHSTQLAMAGAYQDGAHVRLRFDSIGVPAETGDGPVVVEYFRCGGWEWIPVGAGLIHLWMCMKLTSICHRIARTNSRTSSVSTVPSFASRKSLVVQRAANSSSASSSAPYTSRTHSPSYISLVILYNRGSRRACRRSFLSRYGRSTRSRSRSRIHTYTSLSRKLTGDTKRIDPSLCIIDLTHVSLVYQTLFWITQRRVSRAAAVYTVLTSVYTSNRRCTVTGIPARAARRTSGSAETTKGNGQQGRIVAHISSHRCRRRRCPPSLPS